MAESSEHENTSAAHQNNQKRLIVHVDLDAFFAAIEELDHPEYRGKPLVVGSDPQEGKGRGVVSTANYEARKYNIHSALPISTAYRRCPQAIFVRPRLSRYAEVSRRIMEVFSQFSPLVEPLSLDEAFLDCTGTEKLFGKPEELGKKIKSRIKEVTGLTASVGIAGNKYTAKVASDLEKPDGLTICKPGMERSFLAPLPVNKIWGAGKVTTARLQQLGFRTIGQFADADSSSVRQLLGNQGIKMQALARGIDSREVICGHRRKSISEERTFLKDVSSETQIKRMLFAIADDLSSKMRAEQIKGKTITLKIRLRGFETHTRSFTGPPADSTDSLYTATLRAFDSFDRRGLPVRLIGIGVSNLVFNSKAKQAQEPQELDLFTGESGEQGSISRAQHTDLILDALRSRFGKRVKRASLIKTENNIEPA